MSDESSPAESVAIEKLVESWIDDEADGEQLWSSVLNVSSPSASAVASSSDALAPAATATAAAAATDPSTYKCSAKSLAAERRRREKLGELLCTLRALVPNITKMDKASVLSEAINYIKKLQSRVEKLEIQIASSTNPVLIDAESIRIEVRHIDSIMYSLCVDCGFQQLTSVTNALEALELDVISATTVSIQTRRFNTYIFKKEDWDGLTVDQIKQLISQELYKTRS